MKSRYLVALSLMFLPVLAGCGSGGSTSANEKPSIRFTSPALSKGKKVISASYRCDPKKNWLPLTWGSVPNGTRELALYMVRFGKLQVGKGGVVKAPIDAEAIVVGLSPSLRSLSPGRFPLGARIGVHRVKGRTISICPPHGQTGNMLFRLYALPRKLGFDRSSNLVGTMGKEALESGTFIASYRPA